MPSLPHPTISDWLANLDRQGKSHHTCASYRRALAHFTRWSEHTYGQPFDPAAIIPRDVADWKAYQQTVEKAKPSTVNLRLVALSRFFKWAACIDDPFKSLGKSNPCALSPISPWSYPTFSLNKPVG